MTTVTPLLFVLVALAGGAGAAARFVVDGIVRARTRGDYPLGTMVVNVTGSLLLGVLTGLGLAHLASDQVVLVVGTGLLGGYTTFSTASVETVRLLQAGRYAASLVASLGMLVATVAAAGAGLWLGQLGG